MSTSSPYGGMLCFLDTETTGLTPDESAILSDNGQLFEAVQLPEEYRVIELSFIICEPWPSMKIAGECHAKLKLSPEDREKASEKALEVNGYSEEAWSNAIESDANFWYQVHAVTRGTVRVCQNVPFDSSFVYSEMKRFGFKPQWERRYEEMYTFCARLARERNIKDKSGKVTWGLAAVYEAMGFPKLPEHSARPDVLRMMVLYQYMQQRLDQTR
jgi:hypothetical protein